MSHFKEKWLDFNGSLDHFVDLGFLPLGYSGCSECLLCVCQVVASFSVGV